MNFSDDTRAMLLALPRTITLSEVATQTTVSVAWLSRFARNEIPNPGVRNIEALRNWLNARDADV